MTMTVRLWLAAVFIAGLLSGLIHIFLIESPWDHIYSDIGGYVGKAQKMAAGEALQPFDTFFPLGASYLYWPFFAAFPKPFDGYVLGMVQVLCVAASHVLIGATLHTLFGNRRLTIAAAVGSLAYWPLTGQLSFFMAEPIFMALCLGAQYCSVQIAFKSGGLASGVVGGLAIGMAVITKTQGLVFLIAAMIVLLARVHRCRPLPVILFLGGAALVFGLHSTHIARVLDRDGIYMSANGTFNMYLGQSAREGSGTYDPEMNLFFFFYNNNSYIDRNLHPAKLHLGSILDEAYFARQLGTLWSDNPPRQLLRLAVSAFELFTFEPHWPLRNVPGFAAAERLFKGLAVPLIYLPMLVALAVVVNRRMFMLEFAVLLLPVLGMMCAAALTFGQPRYLVPFMPNLIGMAAIGWVSLWPRGPGKAQSPHDQH
jgi:hypothetical protein